VRRGSLDTGGMQRGQLLAADGPRRARPHRGRISARRADQPVHGLCCPCCRDAGREWSKSRRREIPEGMNAELLECRAPDISPPIDEISLARAGQRTLHDGMVGEREVRRELTQRRPDLAAGDAAGQNVDIHREQHRIIVACSATSYEWHSDTVSRVLDCCQRVRLRLQTRTKATSRTTRASQHLTASSSSSAGNGQSTPHLSSRQPSASPASSGSSGIGRPMLDSGSSRPASG